jgi:DNA polymerase-3 subunit gamma/tau
MELVHKYRPDNLDNLISQENIKKYFKNGIHSHFYIFWGPKGVGKTTTARIIGNLLNSVTIEINAADQRGIDKTREIIESLDIPSLDGKPRLFIFDEAHQLSDAAQSSLLKPLGDDGLTQDYVIFCTTELRKLKTTLIDRAQSFEFVNISPKYLTGLLANIAKNEGKEVSGEILEILADNSSGSARNAVQALEKYLQSGDVDTALLGIADPSFLDLYLSLWKSTPIESVQKALEFKNPEQVRIVLSKMFLGTLMKNKSTLKCMGCLDILLSEQLINSDKNEKLALMIFKIKKVVDN